MREERVESEVSPVRAFIRAMLVRGVKTWAQAALGYLGSGEGLGLFEVDWKGFVSVTVMAMIASFIWSIATGLPEAESPLRIKEDQDGEDA